MKSKILQLLMSFVHGAIVIFGRDTGVTSFESRGMAFFHHLLELAWEKHMYSYPSTELLRSHIYKALIKMC